MGNMIFNGISTEDMGVVIQTPPVYEFPNKHYDVINIPGRNGDLYISKNTFSNVQRKYHLATVFKPGENFVSKANEIVAWLNSSNGYAILEDSYEPEYFRLAIFRSSGELPNLQSMATILEVNFECKPQRFRKDGQTPISITNKDTYILIENPTKQIALPEITIEGVDLKVDFLSGENTITPKTNTSLEIDFLVEGIFDSELEECYSLTSSYLNEDTTLTGGVPKLYPGKNWIRVTGGTLTKLSIKPRWWTL